MFKNRNITDFFKPFANPRPAKRAKYDEEEHTKEVKAPASECSSSPRLAVRVKHAFADARPPLEDLTTSSLSSLQSDDSTLFTSNALSQAVDRDAEGSDTFPVVASSQRVSRNGEIMIRNSDDDTDSDVSLEDIGDILVGRNSTSMSSPPTEPELPPLSTGVRVQASRQIEESSLSRNTRTEKLSSAFPIATKYKFSLASLVAKAEEDEAANAGTAQARHLIESLEHQRAALENKIDQNRQIKDLDVGLLASVVEKQGDNGSIGKLLQAIERTEALSVQKCWSFFESTSSGTAEDKFSSLEDFPQTNSSLLPDNLLEFQVSCANGYLGEVAARGKVTDELLQWVLGASSMEPGEDLRRAYISILSHAGTQATSSLSSSSIDMLLRRLGGTKDALNMEHPIEPVWQTLAQDGKFGSKVIPSLGLRNVLKLLSGVVDWMSPESRVHSLCVLCRILVDTSITRDRNNLEAVEDAFESLTSSIPENRFEAELSIILGTTFAQLNDPQLCLQMLRCIPATTSQLSLLRRRLSLAFFFDDPNYLAKKPPDLISFKKITAQLRKPEYSIAIDTDYLELAAAIAILDIGLDDGDPPDFTLNIDLEKKFNEKVERLAEVIKSMISRIADAGASFITRTEAKDGLEAFHNRLVYAVRTKPRPIKMHFGKNNVSAGGGTQSDDFMSKFVWNRRLPPDLGFG